jgi:hypothetical protein
VRSAAPIAAAQYHGAAARTAPKSIHSGARPRIRASPAAGNSATAKSAEPAFVEPASGASVKAAREPAMKAATMEAASTAAMQAAKASAVETAAPSATMKATKAATAVEITAPAGGRLGGVRLCDGREAQQSGRQKPCGRGQFSANAQLRPGDIELAG